MVTVHNPQLIGKRFEARTWIGQGGMGTVFRGVDLETGAPVAIKHLRLDSKGLDPACAERFRREAVALQRLDHPNIVRLLALVHEDDVDYLVMEYVGGGSLEDLLNEAEAPLPIERVLRIGLDVSDALIRTHRLGIVHRDLKPSNVLLAEDGTARLTDFGAAYLENGERLTVTSAIIGTTEYLSPETVRGEQIDARADIWAFGVLLFEMLTRKRPFLRKSVAQTLLSITFSSPPDLQALRPDCPPALVDLVYRMLAKNRNQRVPSARQVSAELDAILHGRGNPVPAIAAPAPAPAPAPVAELRPDRQPIRNNLVAETTTFVGRQPELLELRRRLEDPSVRLVTIVAPGGMGKTRLVVELGHHLIAAAIAEDRDPTESRVAHGVFLVQLAPLSSAEFIVSAIAEAVGLSFYAGREPKQQLLDHFRDKRVVLLMDNFEHVLPGAALVNDLLQGAPGLTVVATSRERLGLLAETLFPLSGMELPDSVSREAAVEFSAVRLFVQAARQQQPGFVLRDEDVDAVIRICRLVQGVPLGIVLAASWAGTLSLQEIADEIGRGLDFLAAELRDLPERQRSMRAVFDHSWALLDAHEREVLARLSVFRGGFTRQAAERVANADLRALSALVNKSLLRRDPTGRYEAHELLRQYAEEKLSLERDRRERALDDHGRFFARYLHEREPVLKGIQRRQALAEIEAEHDNIRAAWVHLAKAGHLDQIAICLEALHLFHTHRASFGEGEAAFRTLVDCLGPIAKSAGASADRPGSAPALIVARALSYQALFLRQLGRFALAERLLEQALGLLNEAEHPREYAFALVAAGSTKTRTGELSEGKQLVERGIALYRSANDAWGLAYALETLGRIYGTAGDFAKSGEAFRESTIVQRASGMLESGLMGLGVASVQQGNFAQGCRMMLDALEMFDRAGDTWNKMRCQMNLANTQRNLGNYGSAEAFARSCLTFWQEVGNWDHEAWCYFQLGNILKEQGLFDAAAQMFEAAHARSVQTGDAGKIALAQLEFGGLALVRGNLREAERRLLESLNAFENAGQAWGTALALDSLGYVACQEGDWPLARARFQRALTVSMSLRLIPFATNTVAGIALLLARTGQPEQAVELLGLVQSHPATERHTITRRVAPLLAELEGALPPGLFSAALTRGRARNLRDVEAALVAPPPSRVA